MDQDRFDGVARALAGGTSRRGAVLAALGALAGGASLSTEAGAKRRKKRCGPPCAAGQTCVKGACRCDNGGTVCGANCCLLGERCDGGTCVELPNPDACIAYGEPCKNVGRRCCENLQCGSGQGGSEVACWVRKTGRCTSTAECIYGTECTDGICVGLPQPDPVPPCNPTFPATAERKANGDALKAAFAEAAANPGSVIVIDSGEYWLGDDPIDDGIVWDTEDVTVTLQACPEAEAVITQTGDNGGMFRVKKGTLKLVGPGLAIRGNTSTCDGTNSKDWALRVDGATATAVLQDVQIVDIGRSAIYVRGGGTAEVNGGVLRPVSSGTGSWCGTFDVDLASTAQLACSPNPAVTGTCVYRGSVNPGNGTCCPTWVTV